VYYPCESGVTLISIIMTHHSPLFSHFQGCSQNSFFDGNNGRFFDSDLNGIVILTPSEQINQSFLLSAAQNRIRRLEEVTMSAKMDSETTRIEISSPTSVAIAAPRVSNVEPFDLLSKEENRMRWGTLKPSAKSLRTVNPIRAIIEPIRQTIQSGQARGDGKDLISLAVRLSCSVGRSVGRSECFTVGLDPTYALTMQLSEFFLYTYFHTVM
jgi:hypothetical protein